MNGTEGVDWRENAYNRRVAPDRPKFKVWSSAGLMLTYWCPSRCACCYVFAGPRSGRPETEMGADQAVQYWRQIRQLAGPRGRVHLTGGEPFGRFGRLIKILQLACEQGLAGLEKIETNAYWCTTAERVRRRLLELRSRGLTKLQVSTDVYHQEYVPIERVRLAVRIAADLLGPDRVQVRWRDFLQDPVCLDARQPDGRRQAFHQALQRRPERLLGRASRQLAGLFPLRPYREFAEKTCVRSLLGARHVHIDGAGNVFPGTCVGLIAGNVRAAGPGGITDLWRRFDIQEHPIMSVLAGQGPVGLAELAARNGFVPAGGYADGCHLCFDVRRFLYDRGFYRAYLGPAVCYGRSEDPAVGQA
ncbi:MAG: radical SAM protein [Sedimentisphaerales bacterium]|nr:radical SAM protein [Sedimentisphaerales bacterium]